MQQFRAFAALSKISGFTKFGAALSLFLIAGLAVVYGQTSSGRISGTITDSTGAVVANAAVTIVDPAINSPRTVTTDANGYYTVTNLPVGTYTVSVEVANFKKAVQSGNVLNADSRLTVDFALETGQVSEVVEVVQESGETVNTTSGEVAKVIDSQQVDNLALNGRNYLQLLTVIPGAVATSNDALDTNLATNTVSINGNRGENSNLAVDGANNLNAGSNSSQINNVGVDLIQEVKIQTSNFSAEYGRSSGAQINVITKRGSNSYRGSAFEFLRNDLFDARSSNDVVKPFLRYHNYGYTFGGPMPFFNFGEGGPMFTSGKDKFYFFFGQEWKTIHRFQTAVQRTLPTTAELNGDFSRRLQGADGIVGTVDDGVLRNPTSGLPCIGPTVVNGVVTVAAVRTGCFAGNIIPASRINPNGRAIANVYRAMQGFTSRFVDTPTANNSTFQMPDTSDFRQESIRLDYIFNTNHSILARYTHDTNAVFDPYGVFIGSVLPTAQVRRDRPGNGLQFGHVWNINSNIINEMKFNKAWSNQIFVPDTPFSSRSFYGYTFTQIYADGGPQEGSIPNTAWGSGNISGFSGVAAALTAYARDYAFTDTLTWVRNNHTFKFGFLYNYGAIEQNGRTNYAGSVNYNGTITANPNTTTNAFADALLGNFRTYSEANIDPLQDFRFKQYEAFAMDSWRVSPRLSLELGVRWQYGTPYYSSFNTIANFDPAYYDPARAVTINSNGTVCPIATCGGNRYNGLVRPEAAVSASVQNDPTVGPNLGFVPAVTPRGLVNPQHYFMPRVGFSYAPFSDNKTAIRGGFGLYYNRVEGNIIFPLGNVPPFVTSASYENTNLDTITRGTVTALTPFGGINAIDPDFKPASSMSFSLGIQRELPGGLFAEANAVGNLSRHLTRTRNINSVPLSRSLANPGVNTALLRNYKGFGDINQRVGDATANYYGMQLYAAKRKGDLLFTTAYTWSKVLTSANSLTESLEDGFANRNYAYGPGTNDRTHVFSGTYTYAPRWFRNSSGFVKALLDGYEISGISRFQTGRPLTIAALSTVGGATRRADIVSGVDFYIKDDRQWLNPAAFAGVTSARLGNSNVGVARGPSFFINDFSVRKRFRFSERRDIRFQADIFNAFNRNNFANVDTSCGSVAPITGICTDTGFGRVTEPGRGRSIQLGVKLGF